MRGISNSSEGGASIPGGPLLPSTLVGVARGQVGLKETGRNKGKDLQKFFDADWYDPNGPESGDDGYPWCAAFICYLVLEAMRRTGVKETETFKRPRTPGAWAFEKWSRAQDRSTWTLKPPGRDIEPGDIVVFSFSHIGLAISRPDDHGDVITIEGNTNPAGSREGDGVYQKVRGLHLIRSRIRFRV